MFTKTDLHLVLLPGLDGTGLLFEALLQALAGKFQASVIAYPLDQKLSYDELEEWIVQRLPTKDTVVLVAESFSGPLALRIAVRYPQKIMAVVLAASFIQSPTPRMLKWLSVLLHPCWFRFLLKPWLLKFFLLGKDSFSQLIERFEEVLPMVSPRVLIERIRMLLHLNDQAVCQKCAQPILYIAATKDRLVRPRCLGVIAQLKPKLVVVRLNGPHLILQHQPREAAQAIENFLNEKLS